MTVSTTVPTTRSGPYRGADRRDPLVWLLGLLVTLNFVYAAAFAVMPDAIRLPFAGLLFASQGALGLFAAFARYDMWRLAMVVTVMMMVGMWMANSAVIGSGFEAVAVLQRMAPVLAMVLFVAFADRMPHRLITLGAGATIVFGLAWAAVQPAYFHSGAGVARFAPFHGGAIGAEDNAHATAYIVLSCTIIVHQGLLARAIPRLWGWGLLGIGGLLIGGYWSTQVQLGFLAYFGACALASRLSVAMKAGLVIVVLGGLTAMMVEKELRSVREAGYATYDTTTAGTGRVATWTGRIDMIRNRTPLRNLIGDGILSDHYTSPTWDKYTHSHNLLLTYILETGFVGTLVFFSTIFLPLLYFGRAYLPFLGLVVSVSMVDMGITHRAMAYMLFAVAVGMLQYRRSGVPTDLSLARTAWGSRTCRARTPSGVRT